MGVIVLCISGCNSIVKYVYQPVCTCMWFTYPYIRGGSMGGAKLPQSESPSPSKMTKFEFS